MKNLESLVDFKKLLSLELQINLNEIQNDSKFTFVTETSIVEGKMNLKESDFNEKTAPLGSSLMKYEKEPKIDLGNKEVINVKACIYLQDVKIIPLSSSNNPVYLEEFVLFSDHILGVTLMK